MPAFEILICKLPFVCLTLNKLGGRLGRKRVKRDNYEKKSIIWIRGR
ncbi:hypothetical protein HanIR_Chr15g0776461 [Helianthus annuus]|nr:hypothetical protein HanIR_Chr15g0776461 [Helianthus annuus]